MVLASIKLPTAALQDAGRMTSEEGAVSLCLLILPQLSPSLLMGCVQVFTKAWSAALLNALGDVISQVYIEKHSFSNLDWKRLGIFTFLV